MATTDVLAGRIGAATGYFLLTFGVVVVVGRAVAALVGWRVASRTARQRRRDDRVQWSMFSRPNLDDGGRTWSVGVERRAEDGRVLTRPVFVAEAIPRDDSSARLDAEGTAMRWVEEYNASGVR